MYNKDMNSKIIKKLLAYAKQHEIFDLAITKKNGQHVLLATDGLTSHELKIPKSLETDLSADFRNLLSLAPADLVSQAYLKTADSTFNLSIIPEGSSEKIIINIQAKSKKLLTMSHLGLGRNERHKLQSFLLHRRGLIIVASSDNQGKTTTLYSLLQKINKDKRSCYSLEEYPELELEEINKIISHKEKRLSDLAQILKSDSEVIMIDDADDKLLQEAVAAAKTGRLILVGIKSNDASEIIDKVKHLTHNDDLETLIIFQKLIKKNCPHCLKAYVVGETEELITKYWPSEKKYQPKYFFTSQGCPKCKHSGTKGEIAVFNLIRLNNQNIDIISSLASDVLQKAANGLISVSKFIEKHRSTSIKKL